MNTHTTATVVRARLHVATPAVLDAAHHVNSYANRASPFGGRFVADVGGRLATMAAERAGQHRRQAARPRRRLAVKGGKIR